MNRILTIVIVLILVIGGYFVYEIIDTDAPDAVSTDAAIEQLTTESGPVEDAFAAMIEVAGIWTIDDDFGEFGFDNASGSFAGFRVEKSFFSGQGATAVGRTGGVSGHVVIDAKALSSAEIVVDMTQVESDESARESAIKSAIKVSDHPTGTFLVTTPVPLDTDALSTGESVVVEVSGDLTVAGVTNSVTVPIEATIVEPGIGLIVGSAELVWADYGVETPQSSVADVADQGVLEFQLIVRANSVE